MEKQSFEQAMKRLEEIAELLEEGRQTLEESIKLFEEANKLAQFCEGKLDEAEKKLRILSKEGDEFQVHEADFEP